MPLLERTGPNSNDGLGDDEYIPGEEAREFLGISTRLLDDWLPDLLRLRRQIKTTEDETGKIRLQEEYDELFHRRFCDELTALDMRTDPKTRLERDFGGDSEDCWLSDDWVGYLMQAQSFEGFDIECYGDDVNGDVVFRKSEATDIMAEGLKYRFTRMGIGPHPYIVYA